ncbi:MAG: (Fe-S)-binding protein [Acidimicrobiia bacterium]
MKPDAGVDGHGSATRTPVLGLDPEELVACVACGLCLPHCPTYRVTGLEIASPRGRIGAMRAVDLEGAPLDAAFVDAMDECIQCRGCEAACPSSVPFGRLMEGTRATLVARHVGRGSVLRRSAEWLAYRHLLVRHSWLLAVTWLLLVAQRLHVVPKRFGLPRLDPTSLRTPLDAGGPGTGDAYVLPGCVMDAWQRDVHRAALRVMRAAGATPMVPGPGADCCGALHVHAGRVDEARALARRLIASMPGDAPIVVDSAGCGAAMKDYGHLLGTPEAHAFAGRVVDFSEWLATRPPLRLRDTHRVLVVQDPCHLRHVQKAHAPVRTVLAPAFTLREPGDDGLCCGAGGAYSALQPELSAMVRDRKVAAIRAEGGDDPLVASANPGCLLHLRAAGLDVRHPAELLADALLPEDAP